MTIEDKKIPFSLKKWPGNRRSMLLAEETSYATDYYGYDYYEPDDPRTLAKDFNRRILTIKLKDPPDLPEFLLELSSRDLCLVPGSPIEALARDLSEAELKSLFAEDRCADLRALMYLALVKSRLDNESDADPGQ